MKLLNIAVKGLPLFSDTLELSFIAQQRVFDEQKQMLYPLFSNVYMNPTTSLIGINASGKTSILKVILFALSYINNKPINEISTRGILSGAKEISLNICFYNEAAKEIGYLDSVITSEEIGAGEFDYSIVSEALWTKNSEEGFTKKKLLIHGKRNKKIDRAKHKKHLPDDISIMCLYNKENNTHIPYINNLMFTNLNILPELGEVPKDILEFLDPSIEALTINSVENDIRLQFKNSLPLQLHNTIELGNYLSSGTIKGIILLVLADQVLKSGGYLIVDEIEDHMNKGVVTMYLNLFRDYSINRNGASLIFTTHYPELLDVYDRNDCIYIVRKKDGISAENLMNIIKRNDLKKSEAYSSGFLGETTVRISAYDNLRRGLTPS